MNLGVQNDALLINHLNKFFNKQDVPWVNLIWNTCYHDKVPQATAHNVVLSSGGMFAS